VEDRAGVARADSAVLRRGGGRDRPFIRSLAADAFAVYGEYGPLLVDWFDTPGVEATIAEDENGPLGLLLLAFLADPEAPGFWVEDILAIAVAERVRRRGLGRRLLSAAIERGMAAARHWPVRALRLSVAEGNAPARALFESAGFQYSGREERFYPRGQRALHMRRPL
jgi:ribosomal protein S18 acetylase RimI-like enzyme